MTLGFRPTFWPTLFTIPALIVLIGLGSWQVHRLQWKLGLIERLETRMAAPVSTLPAEIDAPGGLEYRRAQVTGRFLHDKEMYQIGFSPNGSPGFYVVTPLLRATGPPVLVNRGWVPAKRKDPSRRPEGQLAGDVTVEGMVRLPDRGGWMTPDNEPHNNMWFTLDPAEMAVHAGLDAVSPVYLRTWATDVPGGFPVGLPVKLKIRNTHLQYAITWYAFAVILIVIYVIYHRQQARQ